jgi:regulatory protein
VSRISTLQATKGRHRRVRIFLDGKFAFSLDAGLVAKEGLQVEQELSSEEVKSLLKANDFYCCLNAAIHYLSLRPRSEAELRDRLRRRGFTGDTLETVVSRLKEQGMVDDNVFAQFWKDNRESFSPRSRWLTGAELRQKGVSSDIIEEVVGTIDEADSAYRAGLSKVRSLSRADYESFRRRLSSYLRRRGFSYGVTEYTVKKIWQEYISGGIERE